MPDRRKLPGEEYHSSPPPPEPQEPCGCALGLGGGGEGRDLSDFTFQLCAAVPAILYKFMLLSTLTEKLLFLQSAAVNVNSKFSVLESTMGVLSHKNWTSKSISYPKEEQTP